MVSVEKLLISSWSSVVGLMVSGTWKERGERTGIASVYEKLDVESSTGE